MSETDLQCHTLKNLFALDANRAIEDVLKGRSLQMSMANLLAMITLMIHLYPEEFEPEFMEEIMSNRFETLKKKHSFLHDLDVNFLNDENTKASL